MKEPPWGRRIERAVELAQAHPAAAELLQFYIKVASFQQDVYGRLRSTSDDVSPYLPELRVLVEQASAGELQNFLDRALHQPLMEYRALNLGYQATEVRPTCPFCGDKPVVAVLRGAGEGANRSLLCSMCSVEWPFRRVLCPNCGSEDKEKLPVFTTDTFGHMRIEACDTCHVYIKSVDLTKNGLAVPIVDEIAAVSLDLWAQEEGYEKLQPNVLGV